MSRDPILDEVRAIRDAIAREHNYDIDSIFRMHREQEAKSGRRYVTLSPKRPETTGERDTRSEATRRTDARVSADRRRAKVRSIPKKRSARRG